MIRTNRFFFLKLLIFALGFFGMLRVLTLWMLPKTDAEKSVPIVNLLESPYLFSAKPDGFYSTKKDSLDVVFLGSSNIHCNINPNVIWDQYGITSYNFTSEQQELGTTYYYLKQMFETQSPKVAVIDVFLSGSEESISDIQAHQAFDFMKNDRIKAEAILNRAKDNALEQFLPMIRYHERWKELKSYDFSYVPGKHNLMNGAVIYMHEEPAETVILPESIPPDPLSERTKFWLDSIRQLCEEHNCAVLFIKTPVALYNEYYFYYQAVADYCREIDVPFLFMNKMIDDLGIDFSTDFADLLHMNWSGQQKISSFMGKYLADHYQIENKKGSPELSQWDEDYRKMMYYINNFWSLYQ